MNHPNPSLLPSHQQAQQVFVTTFVFNLLVAIAKLWLGLVTHTLSLLADGFHALLDSFSNVIGWLALQFAHHPPDEKHPYGHKKFEALAAVAISFFMFLAAWNVFQEAWFRFTHPDPDTPTVSWLSLGVVLASVVISLCVSLYEKQQANRLNSDLLAADASHTMSDVWVSVTVLASMAGIYFHVYWLDTASAIAIVGLIFRAGYDIIMRHWDALVDAAVVDPEQVASLIKELPGVRGWHQIRSRGVESHIFIDLHVLVDPNMTVAEGHDVAGSVEEAIQKAFSPSLVDVVVHIEQDDISHLGPEHHHHSVAELRK